MAITPETRSELLSATRESAVAFLEDIPYLRGITENKSPSRAEIRQISGALRRLLVERDLAAVADPRIGRINILAPDLRPAYKAAEKMPFLFFSSGGAQVLGGWSGHVALFDVQFFFQVVAIPQFEISKKFEATLDEFLKQKVLCYRGVWVTRQDVIKYVANVARGVHSKTIKEGSAEEKTYRTLAHIRGAARYELRTAGLHFEFFEHGVDVDHAEFNYLPDTLDPVFVELLTCASMLVASPNVSELERIIRDELMPS